MASASESDDWFCPFMAEAETIEDVKSSSAILRSRSPEKEKALQEFRAIVEDAILSKQLLKPCAGVAIAMHEKRDRVRNKFRRTISMQFPKAMVSHRRGKTYTNIPICMTEKMSHVRRGSVDEGDGIEKSDSDEVSLWGVPLLPSKKHMGTDVVLLKFLEATELKPEASLELLKKNLSWRIEIGVDRIMKEEFGLPELDEVTRFQGFDRKGRPVLYNKCGGLGDRDLWEKMLEDGRMLRWRVKIMEKGIEKLRFCRNHVGSPVESILQIIDLKDVHSEKENKLLGSFIKLIVVLQQNYPKFIDTNILVNASVKHYTHHLFSSRTKDKLIFVRPSHVAEKLIKLIAPEELPVRYGGLRREIGDRECEFSDVENGRVSQTFVKGGGTQVISMNVDEPGLTVVWEATVIGSEVSYKEEFIPFDECLYRVLIRKEKKLEESVRNSFFINDPGRIVLTIQNNSIKKKMVFYRWKTKPTFSC